MRTAWLRSSSISKRHERNEPQRHRGHRGRTTEKTGGQEGEKTSSKRKRLGALFYCFPFLGVSSLGVLYASVVRFVIWKWPEQSLGMQRGACLRDFSTTQILRNTTGLPCHCRCSGPGEGPSFWPPGVGPLDSFT